MTLTRARIGQIAFTAFLLALAGPFVARAVGQSTEARQTLSAEDRLEIQDLINRYSHFVDNLMPEAWASTFTPDGRFEFFDPRDGKTKVFQGRKDLAAFIAGARARGVRFPTHFVGATIMRMTGPGVVHARSEVFNASRDDKPDAHDVFTGVGVYDDQIVKTGEGWRIKSRRAGPNGTIPVHADFLSE